LYWNRKAFQPKNPPIKMHMQPHKHKNIYNQSNMWNFFATNIDMRILRNSPMIHKHFNICPHHRKEQVEHLLLQFEIQAANCFSIKLIWIILVVIEKLARVPGSNLHLDVKKRLFYPTATMAHHQHIIRPLLQYSYPYWSTKGECLLLYEPPLETSVQA